MTPVSVTRLRKLALGSCLGLLTCLAASGGARTAEQTGPKKVDSPRRTAAASSAESEYVRVFDKPGAVPAKKPVAKIAKSEGGALSMLARTGFWLGLIIVLLCGMVVLARKFLPKSMGMFKSPAMELVGRSYLDPKRCVYLLKVGKRVLVVGGAENGLSCLGQIDKDEEVEHLMALASNGAPKGESKARGFAAALGRRLSRLPLTAAASKEDEAALLTASSEEGAIAEEAQVPVPMPTRGGAVGGLDELRNRVEGLKARLRAIS